MPLRRPLALVAVWTAGALVATGTGVLAVRQVADRVSDPAPEPLSVAGVETALAEASAAAPPAASPTGLPTSAAPSPARPSTAVPPAASSSAAVATPAPAPPPAATARSFANEGGSIGVACDGGLPRLVYVTPAQGWSVDDRREDAERVEVRFRSDDGDARLRVACGPGGPVEDPSG